MKLQLGTWNSEHLNMAVATYVDSIFEFLEWRKLKPLVQAHEK
jgi:hypothetical protein